MLMDYDDGSCLFNNNYNVTFKVDMSSSFTFSLLRLMVLLMVGCEIVAK